MGLDFFFKTRIGLGFVISCPIPIILKKIFYNYFILYFNINNNN